MHADRILALGVAAAAIAVAVLNGTGMTIYEWRQKAPQPTSPPAGVARDHGRAENTPARGLSAVSGSSADDPTARAAATLEALTGGLSAQQGDLSIQLPAFDVARIEPNGDAVIAGRAAPGASVELLQGDQVYQRILVDQTGQFVLVPERLPAGDYELTLRSTLPGRLPETSRQSVIVSLAGTRADPAAALVAPEAPEQPNGKTVIDRVQLATGQLLINGRSTPGAGVRLYLNETYLASATASTDGHVAFLVAGGMMAGDYRVRIDQVNSTSGTVHSRAELSFNAPISRRRDHARGPAGDKAEREPEFSALDAEPSTTIRADTRDTRETVIVPAIETAVVARGDNLWRISRVTYGRGARYTIIFGANRDQIRDPHRIYPGQVFVLPNHTVE